MNEFCIWIDLCRLKEFSEGGSIAQMTLESPRIKPREPCDDLDKFSLSPRFAFHFIQIVNVDIRDRHLKHFMTHTYNFRLDSVDVEEESPYKPDRTFLALVATAFLESF